MMTTTMMMMMKKKMMIFGSGGRVLTFPYLSTKSPQIPANHNLLTLSHHFHTLFLFSNLSKVSSRPPLARVTILVVQYCNGACQTTAERVISMVFFKVLFSVEKTALTNLLSPGRSNPLFCNQIGLHLESICVNRQCWFSKCLNRQCWFSSCLVVASAFQRALNLGS